MASIDELRTKYPQYKDMSDQEFADKFYAKYYSDMPRDQFDAKMGLAPQPTFLSKEYNKPISIKEAIVGAPGRLVKGVSNLTDAVGQAYNSREVQMMPGFAQAPAAVVKGLYKGVDGLESGLERTRDLALGVVPGGQALGEMVTDNAVDLINGTNESKPYSYYGQKAANSIADFVLPASIAKGSNVFNSIKTGAIAKAEDLESSMQGVSKGVRGQSYNRGYEIKNPNTLQVDSPIMNAYRVVTEDGGFKISNNPKELLYNWGQRQNQVGAEALGLTQKADVALAPSGGSIAKVPTAEKTVLELRDVTEKKLAAKYLDEQKQRLSNMSTLEDMLKEKQRIYQEYSKAYQRNENANIPPWRTQIDMDIANDLRKTIEEQATRVDPNLGASIQDLNKKWGAYAEMRTAMIKEDVAQAGKLPGEDTFKNPFSSIGNVIYNPLLKQAVASGYRVIDKIPFFKGKFASGQLGMAGSELENIAMLSQAMGTGSDPNMIPADVTLSRDWNTIRQDPAQQKLFRQKAAMLGIDDITKIPEPVQMQVFQQILTTDPTVAPSKTGYATEHVDTDGKMKVLGQDKDLAMQEAAKEQNPAARALKMGPLIKNGTITQPGQATPVQASSKQIDHLAMLKRMQAPAYAAPSDNTYTNETSDMLSQMQKEQLIHEEAQNE